MAETTVLRAKSSSGYVRNAPQFGNTAIPSVRNAPQAGNNTAVGSVLPTVQVKMTGQGPQVQNGHQLGAMPPRTPQPRDQNGNHSASTPGGLPMVQVRMTGQGPQLQSGAPDHGKRQWSAATSQRGVAPVATPTATATVPQLSSDELLFCRHLVDGYARAATEPNAEPMPIEVAQLAAATIVAIDKAMLAIAEADAIAALEPEVAQPQPSMAPRGRLPMVVPQRTIVAPQRSSQHSAASPRRIPRPGYAQPPVATPVEAPPIDVTDAIDVAVG